MAANITYLGEPGRTVLHWGVLDFPVNTPVLVDPDTVETNGERIFYEHVLMKAAKNPHFTYEEVEPAARKGKERGRAEEEPAEDDYPEIPADWREMHHTKMIALANKLGADVNTRDDAMNFIAGYLAESDPGYSNA